MKHSWNKLWLVVSALCSLTPSFMAAQSLTMSPSSATTFCVGDPITVNFTASGTFGRKNAYTFQISDPTGSFTTFTNVGAIIDSTAGPKTITGTIPKDLPGGSHFRLRVIAAVPYTVSANNGKDISIGGPPTIYYVSGPEIGVINESIEFYCLMTDYVVKGGTQVTFDFGADAQPPSLTRSVDDRNRITVSYPTGGIKTVTATGRSPQGCTSSLSSKLSIIDCSIPAIPRYAKVVSHDSSIQGSGQVYWVNPGVTLTDKGQGDTIFAESGSTVKEGSSCFVFLLPGASAASSSNNIVVYAPGGSAPNGGAFNLECPSLVFDYSSAPPNKAVPFASVHNTLALAPIKISPNPTNSMVTVHGIPEESVHITLLNVLGAVVREIENPYASTVDINMSKLASGTYFVRFETSTGVVTKKIVRE